MDQQHAPSQRQSSPITSAPPGIGAGTLIETVDGPQPIDWLVAGDRIVTRDHGLQDLLWIGQQSEMASGAAAYRVRTDLFGTDCPNAVTTLTEHQQILMRAPELELYFADADALVDLSGLSHWPGVGPAGAAEDGPYYSLLFARQELVRANGIWIGTLAGRPSEVGAFSERSQKSLAKLEETVTFDDRYARNCLSRAEARLLRAAPLASERHVRAA